MATVLSPPEQRTLLRDISWETYQGLLHDRQDKSNPRYTYDRGLLEIMSPSFEHEEARDLTLLLVRMWGAAIKVRIRSFGSATFRRKERGVGFEPDCCFYVQNVGGASIDIPLDLLKELPPALIVEIDITNSSIDKLPMFASIGVPEVWIYTNRLRIFKLDQESYSEVSQSPTLPGLTPELIMELVQKGRSIDDDDWFNLIREHATETR